MRTFRTLPAAIALFFLPFGALAEKPKPAASLTILADASLIAPMSELSRMYSTTTHTPLTVLRIDGKDMARRIEQGFDANVLLSANPTLVEQLAQRGQIDVFGTQNVASTQLALVAPVRMKSQFTIARRISFAALLFAHPDLPIFINNPTTPSGMRTQALMDGREFSHELVTRSVPKSNLDEIIAALEDQDGFGLILASNAVAEPGVTVLSMLPESTSEPVRYDAVVLASDEMEQARDFVKFLRSREAQQVLIRFGFQPALAD